MALETLNFVVDDTAWVQVVTGLTAASVLNRGDNGFKLVVQAAGDPAPALATNEYVTVADEYPISVGVLFDAYVLAHQNEVTVEVISL